MATIGVESLFEQLKPLKSANKLYMILDAAKDSNIYSVLSSFGKDSYASLFPKKISQELAASAPYLLQLDRRTKTTKTLLEETWGKGLSIFLESSDNLVTLRHHLQGLLLVKDENGRLLHFRYYDPQVLRVFLPTCNELELKKIFGSNIIRYWVESGNNERPLEEFTPNN